MNDKKIISCEYCWCANVLDRYYCFNGQLDHFFLLDLSLSLSLGCIIFAVVFRWLGFWLVQSTKAATLRFIISQAYSIVSRISGSHYHFIYFIILSSFSRLFFGFVLFIFSLFENDPIWPIHIAYNTQIHPTHQMNNIYIHYIAI